MTKEKVNQLFEYNFPLSWNNSNIVRIVEVKNELKCNLSY